MINIIKINNKLGVLADQKIAIPFEYDYIEIRDFGFLGYLCIKYDKNNKPFYYLYNNDFKLIIKKITKAQKYWNNLIVSDENELEGIVNTNGEILCPLIYKRIISITDEDYFIFCKKDGLQFIGDKYGTRKSDVYKNISNNCSLLIFQKTNGKMGLMNYEFQILIDEQDSIEANEDYNLYECTKNEQTQLLDASGNLLSSYKKNIKFNSIFTNETSSINYVILTKSNGIIAAVINLMNKKAIINCEFLNILYIGNDFALIEKSDGIYQINLATQEEELLYKEYQYLNNIDDNFILIKDNICCVINNQGKMIIPLEYDSINSVFDQYWDNYSNLFIAGKNKKYGIINSKNEIIIPIDYASIYSINPHEGEDENYDED